MTEAQRPAGPTPRLLSLAYNRTSAAIYARLRGAGITDTRPSHGNVMEHLAFEDGLRLSDLSARAGMTPQSMGQLVDELEALGYVERRPDPSDRRAKKIHLTRKGKRSNQTEWKVVQEVEVALKEVLGQRKLNDLRRSLVEIIDELRLGEDTGV
jgi:DNA-binding MarR family transcriptional regulator